MFASTSSVYGANTRMPFSEHQGTEQGADDRTPVAIVAPDMGIRDAAGARLHQLRPQLLEAFFKQIWRVYQEFNLNFQVVIFHAR